MRLSSKSLCAGVAGRLRARPILGGGVLSWVVVCVVVAGSLLVAAPQGDAQAQTATNRMLLTVQELPDGGLGCDDSAEGSGRCAGGGALTCQ